MKSDQRKIIHKSLDGEATREETKILKRSLETDPAVRRDYEALKKVSEDSTVILPPLKAPADFTDKVIGKIRDTARRQKSP